MALATASISAVATATTSAANTTTAKATALLNPLIKAVVAEIAKKGTLTPGQQNVLDTIYADIAANYATFANAIKVTGD